MKLQEIQQALREEGVDAWLFFDHHERDPLAYKILGLKSASPPTRRWYYLIPASGEPRGLVHRIEPHTLETLPGSKSIYSSWTAQVEGLRTLLAGCRRVAMQYSPQCAIPYVAMVDAGTVELVQGIGIEVVSSANLVQLFEARWTQAQLDSHLEAGIRVDAIRRAAFESIGESLRSGRNVHEFAIKQFILDRFKQNGMVTDHGPIVAVNENCSDPHYEPDEASSRPIRQGDFVLIDLWAKFDRPESVFYDITWTGFCGSEPSAEMRRVFEIVSGARDAAVRRVQDAISAGQPLRGFEVDDAARGHIQQYGLAAYFVHRTGHSIGTNVHGAGANMDNLETHDERKIIPWTCFSVEPGVYLPSFGIRSEVNVFVGDRGARVTGEIQQGLVTI
jgi:Xaa-Pro dipeptidase